jgi:hypothetical protein
MAHAHKESEKYAKQTLTNGGKKKAQSPPSPIPLAEKTGQEKVTCRLSGR